MKAKRRTRTHLDRLLGPGPTASISPSPAATRAGPPDAAFPPGLLEQFRGVESSPGVCGGDTRIVGTRIPVWVLEQGRRQGQTESEILASYPSLRAADLVSAWAYVEAHREEIDLAILQDDEDAGPGPDGPAESSREG
jgi:uncharacterized protein (DUF433 family)